MSKAILEYTLPEEQEEFSLAMSASSLSCVITELNQYLRQKIKYAPDSQSEVVTNAYEEIREKLWNLALEYEISI